MNHDTISTRLSLILTKFNSGKRFTVEELSEEFNVSKRTIQRDLNERFSYLPLQRENGYYFLEDYCLGKLSFEDIKNFATLSGIRNLYPNLTDSFIVDLLNSKVNQTYLIKGYEYENLSSKNLTFEQLNIAIVKHQTVSLNYNSRIRELNPYKLINTDGIWYLSADENNKLKTYTISKISNLQNSTKTFKLNNDFINIIEQNQDTWFSRDALEVTLQIDKKVKDYFFRRELLPHQKILKNTDNLIISTTVSYEEELLKVVRYWIPYIKILTPTYLQTKLQNQLQNYINT